MSITQSNSSFVFFQCVLICFYQNWFKFLQDLLEVGKDVVSSAFNGKDQEIVAEVIAGLISKDLMDWYIFRDDWLRFLIQSFLFKFDSKSMVYHHFWFILQTTGPLLSSLWNRLLRTGRALRRIARTLRNSIAICLKKTSLVVSKVAKNIHHSLIFCKFVSTFQFSIFDAQGCSSSRSSTWRSSATSGLAYPSQMTMQSLFWRCDKNFKLWSINYCIDGLILKYRVGKLKYFQWHHDYNLFWMCC